MPNNSDNSKNGGKFIIKLEWWEWVIFVFLVIMIMIAPLVFSQYSVISFTKTGQIGDTIGGISAPFVGLLGAFLVYKSFEAQMRANRELSEQHKDQMKSIQFEQSMNLLIHMFDAVEKSVMNRNGAVKNGWKDYIYRNANKCQINVRHSAQGSTQYDQIKSGFEEAVNKGIDNLNNMLRDTDSLLKTIRYFLNTFHENENAVPFYTFYLDKAEELIRSINSARSFSPGGPRIIKK